jgi:hypothetical protein
MPAADDARPVVLLALRYAHERDASAAGAAPAVRLANETVQMLRPAHGLRCTGNRDVVTVRLAQVQRDPDAHAALGNRLDIGRCLPHCPPVHRTVTAVARQQQSQTRDGSA